MDFCKNIHTGAVEPSQKVTSKEYTRAGHRRKTRARYALSKSKADMAIRTSKHKKKKVCIPYKRRFTSNLSRPLPRPLLITVQSTK